MSATLIDNLMEQVYQLRAENAALKARLSAIADAATTAAATASDDATAWLAELRQKRTSVGALPREAAEVLLPSACLSAGLDQVETEF